MAEITLESLAKDLADQTAKIAEQAATIATLQGKVAQQTAINEPVKLPTMPKDAVKSGQKEYLFQVAGFRLPVSDAVILSEEAILDDALIKQILKIEGQGILKEQA